MIQARLILSGIPDPMRQLPHMHAILNVAELLLLENTKDEQERNNIIRQLYRPTNDDEAPAGFTVQEQRESANAFVGMISEFGEL